MVPQLVRRASGESADAQETSHLFTGEIDNILGNEPSQTLGARRRSKRTLVSPKVFVVVGFLQGQVQVESNVGHGAVFENGGEIHSLELLVESGSGGSLVVILVQGEIEEESDDGTRVAFGVVVDVVEFALGTTTVD